MNFYKELERELKSAGLPGKVVPVPDELKPTPEDYYDLERKIEKRIKENDEMLFKSSIYSTSGLPCGKDIDDVIMNQDFKRVRITEEMRQDVLKHPGRYLNCPPRIRMGLFYTDDEYDKHVEDVLKRPLPGEKKKSKILSLFESIKNKKEK